MNNTTSLEDELLPLTDVNYGPYLNSSLEYYEKLVPGFCNMSDFEKAKLMADNCDIQSVSLTFDKVQLVRVIITWLLFFMSAVGNSFVLFCVCRKSRTSHVHLIMLHFAIADLAFTFLVLPEDALWQTTMQFFGGNLLCKICQMGKQLGMYISSLMVVVMALDRCCGILQPMCTIAKQRKRTKYLVGGAWILSIISAIPAAVLFGVMSLPLCPTLEPFVQCMDGATVPQASLKPYYFFTMAMSFLVPMILCTLFYSLVICEISNMMQRDRVMIGRRDSSVSITRARRKTVKMTALVTLTFLLFWGPYYAYGIYFWFTRMALPREISAALFLLMYVHPAIHPFIYGILMKDVRDTFRTMMLHFKKIITCSRSELSCTDASMTCLQAAERGPLGRANGYSRSVDQAQPKNEKTHVVDGILQGNAKSQTRGLSDGERDRLISTHSEHFSGGSEDTLTPLTKSQTNNNGNGSAKTTRTSQVSFKLPDFNGPEEDSGLNNNKEVGDNRTEDIFKSTDV